LLLELLLLTLIVMEGGVNVHPVLLGVMRETPDGTELKLYVPLPAVTVLPLPVPVNATVTPDEQLPLVSEMVPPTAKVDTLGFTRRVTGIVSGEPATLVGAMVTLPV
jgi:hypothetical protein